MVDDDQPEDRIEPGELEMLVTSIDRTALRRRQLIGAAPGRAIDERHVDGRPMPVHVAEHLDRFRASVSPIMRLDLHDVLLHTVTDGLHLTIGGLLKPEPQPEPRDLLHVYGPDRDSTGERRYYRYAWLDHSQYGSPFSTSDSAIVRSGRLSGVCGVYWGQWAYSVAGAGMLFIAEHGPARVDVRPYVPWLALTSFNHHTIDASVRCDLGILVESWKPGDAGSFFQERDQSVTVVQRSSTEGYLLDSETAGTGGPTAGISTDFVAVPGRRYAITVYAWLETNGGRTGGDGPIGYSRIELDASVPFVVAEETLL
jgi:hypothetical protein